MCALIFASIDWAAIFAAIAAIGTVAAAIASWRAASANRDTATLMRTQWETDQKAKSDEQGKEKRRIEEESRARLIGILRAIRHECETIIFIYEKQMPVAPALTTWQRMRFEVTEAYPRIAASLNETESQVLQVAALVNTTQAIWREIEIRLLNDEPKLLSDSTQNTIRVLHLRQSESLKFLRVSLDLLDNAIAHLSTSSDT